MAAAAAGSVAGAGAGAGGVRYVRAPNDRELARALRALPMGPELDQPLIAHERVDFVADVDENGIFTVKSGTVPKIGVVIKFRAAAHITASLQEGGVRCKIATGMLPTVGTTMTCDDDPDATVFTVTNVQKLLRTMELSPSPASLRVGAALNFTTSVMEHTRSVLQFPLRSAPNVFIVSPAIQQLGELHDLRCKITNPRPTSAFADLMDALSNDGGSESMYFFSALAALRSAMGSFYATYSRDGVFTVTRGAPPAAGDVIFAHIDAHAPTCDLHVATVSTSAAATAPLEGSDARSASAEVSDHVAASHPSSHVTSEQRRPSVFHRGFVGPYGPKTSHSDTTHSSSPIASGTSSAYVSAYSSPSSHSPQSASSSAYASAYSSPASRSPAPVSPEQRTDARHSSPLSPLERVDPILPASDPRRFGVEVSRAERPDEASTESRRASRDADDDLGELTASMSRLARRGGGGGLRRSTSDPRRATSVKRLSGGNPTTFTFTLHESDDDMVSKFGGFPYDKEVRFELVNKLHVERMLYTIWLSPLIEMECVQPVEPLARGNYKKVHKVDACPSTIVAESAASSSSSSSSSSSTPGDDVAAVLNNLVRTNVVLSLEMVQIESDHQTQTSEAEAIRNDLSPQLLEVVHSLHMNEIVAQVASQLRDVPATQINSIFLTPRRVAVLHGNTLPRELPTWVPHRARVLAYAHDLLDGALPGIVNPATPDMHGYVWMATWPRAIDTLYNSFRRLSSDIKLTETIFRGLASAVALMHANGVYHCDLHAGNVLVQEAPDGTLQPAISDFGLTLDEKRLPPPIRAQLDGPVPAMYFMSAEKNETFPHMMFPGLAPRPSGGQPPSFREAIEYTDILEMCAYLRFCMSSTHFDRIAAAMDEEYAKVSEFYADYNNFADRQHVPMQVNPFQRVLAALFPLRATFTASLDGEYDVFNVVHDDPARIVVPASGTVFDIPAPDPTFVPTPEKPVRRFRMLRFTVGIVDGNTFTVRERVDGIIRNVEWTCVVRSEGSGIAPARNPSFDPHTYNPRFAYYNVIDRLRENMINDVQLSNLQERLNASLTRLVGGGGRGGRGGSGARRRRMISFVR